MKKVLIITYYWPPAGGPGVQRVLKFVKYLPEFGIQPIVLTTAEGDYPAIDNSLENEIPDSVKVFYACGWEPYKLYRKFTNQMSDEKIPVAILADNENISFRKRFANWIRLNLFLPDARRFLIKPFVKKGIEIIKNENIDLIITSSPPHSFQIIGKKLKERTKLPWVADFRDPWTKIFYYQNQKRLKVAEIIDNYYERKILASTDILITVSNSFLNQFTTSKAPAIASVIYNGFDEDDFSFLEEKMTIKSDTYTIMYYGNMMNNQVCKGFIQAFKNAIDRYKNHINISLNIIGVIHHEFKSIVNKYNVQSNVKYFDYLDHSKLLKKASEANLLLLIINKVPDNLGILPGKLFEYLGYGLPIIGIGPTISDAAKILNETESGKMFDYKDIQGMERYISNKISNKQISLNRNVANYSRRNQTKRLAQLIKDLLD
ncbi:MAG: glycosyltransferase family 4 protein [Candidatus Marinimicrobia bacterium]|nr:glycosyltransferase family 4 protein [Candidatus Neomarinimicrobiota bacterium]